MRQSMSKRNTKKSNAMKSLLSQQNSLPRILQSQVQGATKQRSMIDVYHQDSICLKDGQEEARHENGAMKEKVILAEWASQ